MCGMQAGGRAWGVGGVHRPHLDLQLLLLLAKLLLHLLIQLLDLTVMV